MSIHKEGSTSGIPIKIKEVIILAGGLGTRLREAVPDMPKCMAPVAGQPFIAYVIDALRLQGIERFIFSLGYKAEVVKAYLTEHYPTLDYVTVVEEEPLGTGGAVQLACTKVEGESVLIVNGDTFFKIDLRVMQQVHQKNNAACTLALKPMQYFDRYGVVTLAINNSIAAFEEKKFYKVGLINGGVYLLHKEKFLVHGFPKKFSFEKDFLEKEAGKGNFFGSIHNGFFIDIGIPEDFNRAQQLFQKPILDLTKIDKSWTLFLDRDGVLNDEILHEYVLSWDEFHFSTGVLEAMKTLAQKFGVIVVVTNQRGVTKGLMTEGDLHHIHDNMQKEVIAAGGRIDKIYYCTHKDNTCFNRKPNPGMALQAFADFPAIDPKKTIMVGNKPSDMRFGRAAGVFTVFVATTNPHEPYPHPDVDLRFDSLLQLAQAI